MADSAGSQSEHPLDSTSWLLERARAGDAAARDRLFERVLPPLRRWAHQRMPAAARDLHETDDIVQIVVMRGFARLEQFESRGPGAFLGYLRQILLNAIRDEVRRTRRRAPHDVVDEQLVDPGPSVFEVTLGKDALARYERALAALPDERREALIMRIELGFSFQEIADAQRRPSANAARVLVARALLELADGMGHDA